MIRNYSDRVKIYYFKRAVSKLFRNYNNQPFHIYIFVSENIFTKLQFTSISFKANSC